MTITWGEKTWLSVHKMDDVGRGMMRFLACLGSWNKGKMVGVRFVEGVGVGSFFFGTRDVLFEFFSSFFFSESVLVSFFHGYAYHVTTDGYVWGPVKV